MARHRSLSEAGNAREDLIGTLRPDERLAVRVVRVDELADGGLEFAHTAVYHPAQLLIRQLREPALHEVEPGARGPG
jgi:hypothetical protein